MKKLLFLLLCLFYTVNSYSETRIGIDVGHKFNYVMTDSKDFLYSNNITYTPMIEISIFKKINLLFEIEISQLLDPNATLLSTTYLFGIQYHEIPLHSLFLRPGVTFGLFGSASYSGPALMTIPGASPFIDINLTFGKQIQSFEIQLKTSWRKETSSYSSICSTFGVRYIF